MYILFLGVCNSSNIQYPISNIHSIIENCDGLNFRYAGFYKGVQSAGAAIAWQIDSHNVPFLNQLIVNWILTTISYPLLAVLIILAVKDIDNEAEGGGSSKEGTEVKAAVHSFH